MIVWLHVSGSFGLEKSGDLTAANCGFVQGVSLFFVLSGFILTYNYGDGFGNLVDVFRFIGARFARIWPAHAVANVIMMLSTPVSFWYLSKSAFPLAALLNFALVHSFVPNSRYYGSINPPSWSVSTEFAFYLLFPFMVANIRRRWMQLFLLSFFMLAICLLVAAACCFQGPKQTSVFIWVLCANPLGRLYEFVLGMIACRLVMWNAGWLKQKRVLVAILELIGLSLAIAGIMGVPSLYHHYEHTASAAVRALTYWMTLSGGAPGYALLIAALALESGPLYGLLKMPYLVALGEISYSMYLMHYPVMVWFQCYLPKVSLLEPHSKCFFYFLVLIAASALLYKFVEVPARTVIRGWWDELLPQANQALPIISVSTNTCAKVGSAR
jgi:peptidoglycan/LPS O-acetylase OafA/YrhL